MRWSSMLESIRSWAEAAPGASEPRSGGSMMSWVVASNITGRASPTSAANIPPKTAKVRINPFLLLKLTSSSCEAVCASVGAYQLEGLGAHLFTRIEGDYFTVLGLPLLPLLAFLAEHGIGLEKTA